MAVAVSNRITGEQREDAWKRYQSGESIKDISQSVGVSYISAWFMTEGRRRGFGSWNEYQKHLAKERGFGSYGEYREHLAKERGFGSLNEYREHLAKERGFGSLNEYREHLAKERANRNSNKELSYLIKTRLREIGKNQSWLADQIGVSRQAVSFYSQGKLIPKAEVLNRLFEVFGVERKSKTLEDIAEN